MRSDDPYPHQGAPGHRGGSPRIERQSQGPASEAYVGPSSKRVVGVLRLETDSVRKIPISLLTGFLGSGKTTVLNHLLRQPAMANVMVIINEFGEIGLDHDLVERATDDMILLQSGCLCCTIRGDLIDTLRSLYGKRSRSDIPQFDRVVIETTGLA